MFVQDELYRKMNYYTDRANKNRFLEIADKCVKGILVLENNCEYDTNNVEGNLFTYEFKLDPLNKKEYLFTMDYLTCVLSAFKQTREESYKYVFNKIVNDFYDYLMNREIIFDDLPIYGQVLLFIKALDIVGDIPHLEFFLKLMKKYANWLNEGSRYTFIENHGIFIDLALLHLSVLFDKDEDSKIWRETAIKRQNKLFSVAFYADGTNNEHSISYFRHNIIMYQHVISFCDYYGITGIDNIKNNLEKSYNVLNIFAHRNNTFPIIGDGKEFSVENVYNEESKLFPDSGLAVIKTNSVYFTIKAKTVFQSHAHTDISSITLRFKDTDIFLDSGQYSYDRYNPINRFLRSSAGHSGFFPIIADNYFQKQFVENVLYSEITQFEHRKDYSYVEMEYHIWDIQIKRKVCITDNKVIVTDAFKSQTPHTMRQRFVIPKHFIEYSKYAVSKRLFESRTDDGINVKIEINTDIINSFTEMNFGVYAPQYNEFETTMLLDTFSENETSGSITAIIAITED